jgi:hypothetical protein
VIKVHHMHVWKYRNQFIYELIFAQFIYVNKIMYVTMMEQSELWKVGVSLSIYRLFNFGFSHTHVHMYMYISIDIVVCVHIHRSIFVQGTINLH